MTSRRKDELIVYWAPFLLEENEWLTDWNILYNDPVDVYKSLKEEINKDIRKEETNLFLCPAVKDMFKNTFYFSSGGSASYTFSSDNAFSSERDTNLGITDMRHPSLKSRLHVTLGLQWVFFCEEPLKMEVTPPYLSDAAHTKYGSVVPGTFDIGNWFRPMNAEFILSKNSNKFVIESNEPIFYAKFITDKNVVFKRFKSTNETVYLVNSCVKSPQFFGKYVPLIDRYKVFNSSRTRDKVLKVIRDNLI